MEISFGQFLNQKRKELELTQKELANKLFVSESAVSKWEKMLLGRTCRCYLNLRKFYKLPNTN